MERTQIVNESLRAHLDDERLAWDHAVLDAAGRRAHVLAEPTLLVRPDARGGRVVSALLRSSASGAPLAVIIGAHDACDVARVPCSSSVSSSAHRNHRHALTADEVANFVLATPPADASAFGGGSPLSMKAVEAAVVGSQASVVDDGDREL